MQTYECNHSQSVQWSTAGPSSVVHWNKHDPEYNHMYSITYEEHFSNVKAQEEARNIAKRANDLKEYWMKSLRPCLRCAE